MPLFVEDLTKTVLTFGLLEEQKDRYTLHGPLLPLAIPATLRDALLARLDRLAAADETPSRTPPRTVQYFHWSFTLIEVSAKDFQRGIPGFCVLRGYPLRSQSKGHAAETCPPLLCLVRGLRIPKTSKRAVVS